MVGQLSEEYDGTKEEGSSPSWLDLPTSRITVTVQQCLMADRGSDQTINLPIMVRQQREKVAIKVLTLRERCLCLFGVPFLQGHLSGLPLQPESARQALLDCLNIESVS